MKEAWVFVNQSFEKWLDNDGEDFEDFIKNIEVPNELDKKFIVKELESLHFSFSASESFLAQSALESTHALELEKKLHDLLPKEGQEVAQYQLEEKIGEGGFGRVYRAFDQKLKRYVAIKISAGKNLEAQAMAQLDHENIVKIYEQNQHPSNRFHYTVMEFVGGPTLETVLKKWQGQSYSDFLQKYTDSKLLFRSNELQILKDYSDKSTTNLLVTLVKEVAQALEAAHRRNVYHLDIKPSNILVTHYGRAKLIDFNIALNHEHVSLRDIQVGGSKKYMSPEQQSVFSQNSLEISRADYANLDGRSDIYSLGLILEEVLKLHPPQFDLLSSKLESISQKATAKDLKNRYSSIQEFTCHLDKYLQHSELLQNNPSLMRMHFLSRNLLLGLIASALIPQLMASFTNISYNALLIFPVMNRSQKSYFFELVENYNLVVYPLCLGLFFVLYKNSFCLLRKDYHQMFTDSVSKKSRLVLLRFTPILIFITSLGWLPGTLYFPLSLHQHIGGQSSTLTFQLVCSFIIGWLVSTIYSVMWSQSFALFEIFPRYFDGNNNLCLSKNDLDTIERRFSVGYCLAGFLPLLGAVLLILLDSSHFSDFQIWVYRGLTLFCLVLSAGSFIMGERLKNRAWTLTRYLRSL